MTNALPTAFIHICDLLLYFIWFSLGYLYFRVPSLTSSSENSTAKALPLSSIVSSQFLQYFFPSAFFSQCVLYPTTNPPLPYIHTSLMRPPSTHSHNHTLPAFLVLHFYRFLSNTKGDHCRPLTRLWPFTNFALLLLLLLAARCFSLHSRFAYSIPKPRNIGL